MGQAKALCIFCNTIPSGLWASPWSSSLTLLLYSLFLASFQVSSCYQYVSDSLPPSLKMTSFSPEQFCQRLKWFYLRYCMCERICRNVYTSFQFCMLMITLSVMHGHCDFRHTFPAAAPIHWHHIALLCDSGLVTSVSIVILFFWPQFN